MLFRSRAPKLSSLPASPRKWCGECFKSSQFSRVSYRFVWEEVACFYSNAAGGWLSRALPCLSHHSRRFEIHIKRKGLSHALAESLLFHLGATSPQSCRTGCEIQDVEMLRCSHAVDIQSSRYGLHKIIDASPHQILEHLNGRSRPPRPEPRFSRKTTHASHTIGPHPSDAVVQKSLRRHVSHQHWIPSK